MKQLRQAAARERRAPIYWWLTELVATGGGLVIMVYHHSHPAAYILVLLLVAAWVAPLVALHSLAMPRRPQKPRPPSGGGSFNEWRKQARWLGRLLLYYGDVPDLPGELRCALLAARSDLQDTLRAHPLRDDLERVCDRIRGGVLGEIKNWFAREYRSDIRELANEYESAAAATMDSDKRLLALQAAVEKAAALMSRNCMPRILERERLACAGDCAWLAVQASVVQIGQVSPVDLAEMLVIEWSDFSEPWQPASALERALSRLQHKAMGPSPEPEAEPAGVVTNGKRYRRVRVRVRRQRRRHSGSRHRGPSIWEVLMSFGQWVRYSIRAWTLYR